MDLRRGLAIALVVAIVQVVAPQCDGLEPPGDVEPENRISGVSVTTFELPDSQWVRKVRFSPDSKRLAALVEDDWQEPKTLHLWDLSKRELLGTYHCAESDHLFLRVAVGDQGDVLLAECSRYSRAEDRLLRVKPGNDGPFAKLDIEGWITAGPEFCLNGEGIAVVVKNRQVIELRVYDPLLTRIIKRMPCPEADSMAVSATGKEIALTRRGEILTFDIENETQRQRLMVCDTGLHRVTWSPDGALLMALASDARVFVVDAIGKAALRATADVVEPGECVFAPNQHDLVVLGLYEGKLSILSGDTLKVTVSIDRPKGRGLNLNVSPSGIHWAIGMKGQLHVLTRPNTP